MIVINYQGGVIAMKIKITKSGMKKDEVFFRTEFGEVGDLVRSSCGAR